MRFLRFAGVCLVMLSLCGALLAQDDDDENVHKKKKLLAIGMSEGFQHDSVSNALATLWKIGQDSGLWDTYVRTDVQLITKKKLGNNAKNLNDFDAVFFMTTGELPLDDQQKADLMSFIKEDGKGFLGAHNATDTLYKWPDYGDMIGGYFDGHPWNQFTATIRVEDRKFPAMAHFPKEFKIMDEIYQIKEFSRSKSRVLMSIDPATLEMTKDGVHQKEFPVTWVKNYGKGRVFFSGLGHRPEVWARPDIQKMWLEAVKWAMGITTGDATPNP